MSSERSHRFNVRFSSEGWEGAIPSLGLRVTASNYNQLHTFAARAVASTTGVAQEAVQLERFLELPDDVAAATDAWQRAEARVAEARLAAYIELESIVDMLGSNYSRSQRDAAQIVGIKQPTLNKILKRTEALKAS